MEEIKQVQRYAGRFITSTFDYTPGSTSKDNMQKLGQISCKGTWGQDKDNRPLKCIKKPIDKITA